jgi:hypothetical protein
MPTKMKLDEAAKIVVKMILDANIPSHRRDNRNDLQEGRSDDGEMGVSAYFDNPHIFGYECNLSVNLKRGKVEVGWSSSSRSPSQARANIVLYTQVCDLAALIESFIDGIDVKS